MPLFASRHGLLLDRPPTRSAALPRELRLLRALRGERVRVFTGLCRLRFATRRARLSSTRRLLSMLTSRTRDRGASEHGVAAAARRALFVFAQTSIRGHRTIQVAAAARLALWIDSRIFRVHPRHSDYDRGAKGGPYPSGPAPALRLLRDLLAFGQIGV